MSQARNSDAIYDSKTLLWCVATTVAFEVLTLALRFGAGLESTRDTASTVGRLTLGLRIHHSYIGIAMLPIAMVLQHKYPVVAKWIFAIGVGLFFSDMIHHFLVLWPIVGSPQFDFWYE